MINKNNVQSIFIKFTSTFSLSRSPFKTSLYVFPEEKYLVTWYGLNVFSKYQLSFYQSSHITEHYTSLYCSRQLSFSLGLLLTLGYFSICHFQTWHDWKSESLTQYIRCYTASCECRPIWTLYFYTPQCTYIYKEIRLYITYSFFFPEVRKHKLGWGNTMYKGTNPTSLLVHTHTRFLPDWRHKLPSNLLFSRRSCYTLSILPSR